MTWEWTAFSVAAFAFAAVALWLVLPYLRKRTDEERRLAALEVANVELRDSVKRIEQAFEGPALPRGLPRVGVSR